MNPYAGSAGNFPASILLPDDSDPPMAATFNPAPQGLADRTMFLLNIWVWGASRSWFSLNTQSNKLIAAAWDPKGAQWWACSSGNTDKVANSVDDGKTWGTPTPGTSVINLQSIAVDNSGRIVTTGTKAAIGLLGYQFDGTTWHNITFLVAGNVTLAEVVWESTQNVWYVFGWDNASAPTTMRIFTSTDRATWTEHTASLPALIANSAGAQTQPRIGVGGGRVVVADFYSGKAYVASAPSNANPTWSTAATLTPTMSTPLVVSDPAYVASSSRWLIVIEGTNGGVPCSEVWKSDDGGITWSQLKVLGGTTMSIKIIQLAILDPLICGLTSDGYTIASSDAGATWYIGRYVGTVGAVARSIWAGDGGFLELDTGGATDGTQASIRTGTSNHIAVVA